MTPEQQYIRAKAFFDEALRIVHVKSHEYSPEGTAMMDVYYTAADLNVEAEQVLWMHLRKHLAVVRTWVNGGAILSDMPSSRMMDAANYLAMIEMLVRYKSMIMREVAAANEIARVDEEDRAALRAWLSERGVSSDTDV